MPAALFSSSAPGAAAILGICAMFVLVPFAAEASGYRAGVASVVITPEEPMWLAGYTHRDHPSEGKIHDLWAKALVLEDPEGRRLVVVTTDLLGLPKSIADPVAETIGRRFHLERGRICLTSSHTHCGPVLRNGCVDMYSLAPVEQAKIDTYSRKLQDKLVEAAARAMADLAPARLHHGTGQAGFAMNRRENDASKIFKNDKLIEGYVPKGPVDHDVPVLRVTAENGRVRAILFGYACHGTTMNFYHWCGDYAGFAQLDLQAAYPGATAMFFAGCGGDSNPLPRHKLELCRKYGRELSGAVNEVLKSDMKPVEGPLTTAWRVIDLPLAALPTREDLRRQEQTGSTLEKRRATRLLAQLDAGRPLAQTYPYPVQVIQFGSNLTAVVLGGEVVVDYSLRLKRELGRDKTWVVAYANDVPAYIPSRRVLAEGRYEGRNSMVYYGLPTVWNPAIEDMIVGTVHELANTVRR